MSFSNSEPTAFRNVAGVLLGVFLATSAMPVSAAPQPSTDSGSIQGEVVDRDTRQPVVGAIVLVEGMSLTAVVGDDGRFRLEHVPAAVHIIRAEASGYAPLSSIEIKVPANRSVTVVLELARVLTLREEVVVIAPAAPRPPNVTTSNFEFGSEEIRRSAGSMGDVSRLVQALPGLAALGDLRNDLVVRGGNPSENLTLVDGFEVPTVNHFPTTGTTGGAAFIAEGPLGGRGSWIATGRRSFLDMLANAAGGDVEDTLPRMAAYTFKANADIGPRDFVWIVGFGGSDRVRLVGDADNLDEPDFLTIDNDGWRTVTGVLWSEPHVLVVSSLHALAFRSCTSLSVSNGRARCHSLSTR